jgi:hypothetical protein
LSGKRKAPNPLKGEFEAESLFERAERIKARGKR